MGARRRRWLRRTLCAVAALLVLLLLSIGGLLWYLASAPGERQVRQRALAGANGAIQGRIGWDGLDVHGEWITLRGLKLHDPEGNLVAEIESVDLRIGLRALAAGRLIAREARVHRPRLYLVDDERGLNLSRALAARGPKAAGAGFAVSARVDQLTLDEGYVDFEEHGPKRDLHARLEDLTAQGSGSYQGRETKVDALLDFKGRSSAPVPGRVAGALRLTMAGDSGSGSARAELPGAAVEVSGDFSGTEKAHLEVQRLELDPATARAFFPEYPLKATVMLRGRADQQGNLAHLDLEAAAAGSTLHLAGAVDLARLVSPGLTAQARGVNLADLFEGAPKTELSLELRAKGGGTSLETLDGELSVDVPPSRVRGEPLGPLRLRASAAQGRFAVPELSAVLPGVSLTAAGGGTLDRISVHGHLGAWDLSRLGRTLGHLAAIDLPALAGSGAISFSAEGPLRHPGARLDGAFASLHLREVTLRDLAVHAELPDVARPLDSEATLSVGFIRSGERVFREVQARVSSQGQSISVDASVGGAISARLAASGQRDPDSRGVLLSSLSLTYPEASWVLRGPSHLGFRERITIEKLELRSGTQELFADGAIEGRRLDGEVRLGQFDLAGIPKVFLDPALALEGVVDAEVVVHGNLPRPEVTAKVHLARGRFQEYRNLGADVDGRYAADRATGTAALWSDLATLRASFDAPVIGLLRGRAEPLRVQVALEQMPLKPALAALGRPESAEGAVDATVVLAGTARAPALAAVVRGRGVRIAELPPRSVEGPDFDLRVQSGAGDRLSAHLDLMSATSTGAVELRTPLTLAGIIERPPTLAQLRAMAVEVDASLLGVPLEALHVPRTPHLLGTADLRAELRGSANAPTLNAELAVHGAHVKDAQPTDGRMALVATRERIDLTAGASRQGRQVLDLSAALGAPLSTLLDPSALPRVPLRVSGVLHPISIAEFVTPAESEDDPRHARVPSGTALARLDAEGTLDAPVIHLRSNVEELRLGETCLGRAAVALDYRDARSTLGVDLTSIRGGKLRAEAAADLELGYTALRKGVRPSEAKVQGRLEANKFELGSLTGLIPKVRSLGGLFDADVGVRGTLGAPALSGRAEWADGTLALEGYGEYEAIHLLATATNDTLRISDLSAKSGAGSVKATADARRQGAGFALQGAIQADKFPVVYDDQLMAIATARLTLEGDASSKLVNVHKVAIPEAHIELPELYRRDLQDLDRPDDVVLVRNGRPLRRRRPVVAATKAPAGLTAAAVDTALEAGKQPAPVPRPAEEHRSREYRFVLDAPRNLWVRSTADVNLEVGLEDGFRIEYQDTASIYGGLRVLHGSVVVLGRRFEIQRDAEVKFTGPPKQPYVNATAEYYNERENVTVFATVRGQGTDITLTATSEPPLPETDIFTLIATGRRTLKRGSGATMNTGDAVSILGAYFTSQLKRTVLNKLPLDVITVQSTGEGLTGTQAEIGTYLTDKWYMGATGRVGGEQGENTYGVRIEYQLSPETTIQGEYGDQKKGADLIWSKDY